jgi:hypothetical protein
MRRESQQGEHEYVLEWTDTVESRLSDDEIAVVLQTSDGDIQSRFHPAHNATMGVVWVGGAGGGLDGLARGLYPAGCAILQEQGIAGLRLHYRRPNDLPDCVLDTLLGVEFLNSRGIERTALVGHSFGGAVVITAGAVSEKVHAVVPMSTQTYGTELAPQVSPRPMLLVHGTDDEILPDTCSRQVYRQAAEPKRLVLYPGARHGLDEAREELLDLLTTWIPDNLKVS